jgi:predicted PurR-regulated permease PerM
MSKTPLKNAQQTMELGRGKRRSQVHVHGQPFAVRSSAVTAILILLVVYGLKLASVFFIPVVLALLLNFLFGSVIRDLGRFYVPAPLSAILVLFVLLGSLGLGIYQLRCQYETGW